MRQVHLITFCVACMMRDTTVLLPALSLNCSFTLALISVSLASLGSWMKAPPLLIGGISPVVAYLRHSMIVWGIGMGRGSGSKIGQPLGRREDKTKLHFAPLA